MYLQPKARWKPDPVTLLEYAADCVYWRQGVSTHVLRQSMTEAQKTAISTAEFVDAADFEGFKQMNKQDSLLCQFSTSSSEVTEQLLQDCAVEDKAITEVDYLIYCHRSIDLEFYSSPACRAQNAIQNKQTIPLAISQCGTAAGLYGIEMAMVLAESEEADILLSLNELGVMPARRRILDDVLVNDGSAVLHLSAKTKLDGSVKLLACRTVQQEIMPVTAEDMVPVFKDLIGLGEGILGSLRDVKVIMPKYSEAFKVRAAEQLPKGLDYVFEDMDGGYSGTNFAYNAIEMILDAPKGEALIVQMSETGASAVCAVERS